jgi:ribosomal protein S12 methylthiotransferase accessory factor
MRPLALNVDGQRFLSGHTAKNYVRGTHRTISPAETLARLKPLLPKMGITRLANVTGLDTIGIPVVMSVRPCSRSLSVSQGKGLDLDSARVSAAMESIEGYHAERVTGPLELASYDELRQTHAIVDPLRLPLSLVRPFQTTLPLLWIAGDDWLRHEQVWVPFQLVHTAYTTRMRWDLVGFAVSSTGLASGNHVLEAVSHALCEIVERDASARFAARHDEQREACRLDLRSVDDADCRAVLERYHRAGVDVAVWDVTSHVGLAAFDCLIAEHSDDPNRMLSSARGMGCHPARQVALLRALTEAAQSRLTIIAGSRDDMGRASYAAWRDPVNSARWRHEAADRGCVTFASVPTIESDSFEEDVNRLLGAIAQAGCDRVVVVDLTRPEIGIPVVRVIVPGLHDEGQRHPVARSGEDRR